MSEKLIMVPENEEYMKDPYTIYYTRFMIGNAVEVEMLLLKTDGMKSEIEEAGIQDDSLSILDKGHICIVKIGMKRWVWNSGEEKEMIDDFKKTVSELKYGKDVIFNDRTDKTAPVRVSHRGVEFIW